MLLHCGCHTVGEVLPAVCDHVTSHAVLGREGTGAGAHPGQRGEVGAEPQVQGNAGAVDTELYNMRERRKEHEIYIRIVLSVSPPSSKAACLPLLSQNVLIPN